MKVLIADDDVGHRTFLHRALEREEDLQVVAEARNAREACRLAQEVRPDVVLMDMGIGGSQGLEASRRITGKLPKTQVVMFGILDDSNHVKVAEQYGANTLLSKHANVSDILSAIRRAYLVTLLGELFGGAGMRG